MPDPIVATDLAALSARFAEGSSFKQRRVLITGGSGFIGSWVSDFLVGQGSSVICLDDMSTGLRGNISHLIRNSRFKFLKRDVTKGPHSGLKCDLIFHLASHPSPEEYEKQPVKTIVGSSHGTLNMLEVARKNDAVLLFASTSEVYGDAQVIPTPETYWGNVNPIGPRSCYDEGKRFGEALCMAYNRAYGLDVRIVRLFNTYGPRLRADGLYARALSRFVKQAQSGADITIYGDGTQTRSFCYVTDTLAALLPAATRPQVKSQVLNIGNPNETSILTLAEMIIKITDSKSKITYHKLPTDDPRRRCPDISRALTLLSWSPHVGLKEGLSKTIKWFAAKKSR